MERAKESQGESDQSVKDFKTGADQSWIVSQQNWKMYSSDFFPNILLSFQLRREDVGWYTSLLAISAKHNVSFLPKKKPLSKSPGPPMLLTLPTRRPVNYWSAKVAEKMKNDVRGKGKGQPFPELGT